MTGPTSLADHAGARLTQGKPTVNGVEIHYAIGGSVEQPGGTRAILEMYRARPVDTEQNRPHYANPISCPVLAVGGQSYLGDHRPSPGLP
jgi:hypothetical protein